MRCADCPSVSTATVRAQSAGLVWVKTFYCGEDHMVVDGYVDRNCTKGKEAAMNCPRCRQKMLECGQDITPIDLRTWGEANVAPDGLLVKVTHSHACQYCDTQVQSHEIVKYTRVMP